MANTPDVTECAACRRQGDARLPIDPWRSLAVHFGMLLGVEDFKTVDAYHRGKMWLHSAWLHREGVIWGLAPSLPEQGGELRGELRIEAGLALDACGRELHLDRAACIDLGRWFTARAKELLAELGPKPEGEQVITPKPLVDAAIAAAKDAKAAAGKQPVALAPINRVDSYGGSIERPIERPLAPERAYGLAWTAEGYVKLDAHVRMRFVGCLDRQVPALVEPCDGAGRTTAYSRVYETVELELVPGLPEASPQPYPHLRMLFGLDEPEGDVKAAREAIAALPPSEQPAAFEEEFHRFAAIDAAALAPANESDGSTLGLLPAVDPAWFVLAELHGLTVAPDGDAWQLVEVEQLIWDQRPTHVATRPLQDLVAASLAALPAPSSDAGGPRIIRASLTIAPKQLSFSTNEPIELDSLAPERVQVSAFVPGGGWKTLTVSAAKLGSDGTSVTVEHDELPDTATRVRLRVDGTSSTPVLGVDGWPLAGADDDPPTSAHAGRDFAHIERRGE